MSYYHYPRLSLDIEETTRVWFQVSFSLSLSILQRNPHWSWCCWLRRYRYSNPGCRPFLALLAAEAASPWGGWCATRSVERRQLHSQKQVCNIKWPVWFFEHWASSRNRLVVKINPQGRLGIRGPEEWMGISPLGWSHHYHINVQTPRCECV